MPAIDLNSLVQLGVGGVVVIAVVAMLFRFLLSRSSNGNDSNKTEVLTVKLTAAIEALTDNMRDLKTEMTSHAQENRAGFQRLEDTIKSTR